MLGKTNDIAGLAKNGFTVGQAYNGTLGLLNRTGAPLLHLSDPAAAAEAAERAASYSSRAAQFGKGAGIAGVIGHAAAIGQDAASARDAFKKGDTLGAIGHSAGAAGTAAAATAAALNPAGAAVIGVGILAGPGRSALNWAGDKLTTALANSQYEKAKPGSEARQVVKTHEAMDAISRAVGKAPDGQLKSLGIGGADQRNTQPRLVEQKLPANPSGCH